MAQGSARRVGTRRGRRSRFGAGIVAFLMGVSGLLGAQLPAANAADPTAAMTIHKSATSTSPKPGEKFSYVVQVQCTAGTVTGCVDAAVHDPLPEGLTVAGDITVSGAATPPVITPANPVDEFTVTFKHDLGGGDVGLAAGVVVTISVPVQLDADYPPSKSGIDLPNTATITADNAIEQDSTAVVTPEVPAVLDARTSKAIEQAGALPEPGTPVDATLTGTNTSNVPVDTMVISDPVDPTADPNPFSYLALDSLGTVTLPEGAETVRVRAYVDGAWVDGPLGPPAALSSTVDPADVRGLQFVFSNTAGEGIAPGAAGSVDLKLVQTAAVVDAPKPLVVTNTAQTTVTLGTESTSSGPASDTYRIPPSAVSVAASKSFDPSVVKAGDPSTVTLGATNTTDNELDSLTITEPSGAQNPFINGLTFTGLGSDGAGTGIVWPRGATEATITYVCDGTPGTPLSTTTEDTLPAPPAGCDPITGFTVRFTGSIAQGAEATIPFGVVTDADQATEEFTRSNTIDVAGQVGGITGTANATDEITSIKDRLAIEVGKKISPSQIPSRPGQIAVTQLNGRVKPFPDSTTDARQIIVSDPDPISGDEWFTAFAPQSVTATAVPADSTLTVQYWDGATWQTVPGMDSIAGPTIVNQQLPGAVSDAAQGLRFIYASTLAAPDGFAPGTTVAPNFTNSLRSSMDGSSDTISNCVGATAVNGGVSANADPTACDDLELIPADPGNADPIDKSWDKALLNARSQQESGITISWATEGYTGLQTVTIADPQDAETTALTDSVYDVFDLVRIDPITAAADPHLAFDQITSVQLYSRSSGSWQAATNDPCPAACDGTFPGVSLTAAESADSIGFRLVYVESPTRAQRVTKPTDPPVGTGVAASLGKDRHVHPVMRLRDELRSNNDIPVTEDHEYNITGEDGQIRNTARLIGVFDDATVVTATDSDDIALRDVPVTVNASKKWTGGPMSRPADGVPGDQYPTGRLTIGGTNTTPAKVDRLVITDPSGGTDPFDAYNVVEFTAITTPASIGAADLQIVLNGGTTCTTAAPCTRAQALALTEAQLTDVTGLTLTYTGRINAGATATATFDARLRPTTRSTGEPTPTGVFTNTVGVEAADLANYPNVTPVTATDDATATMRVQPSGVDVHAAKSFSPGTITEPDDGPTTVTLQGQPDGVSRTVEMRLSDTSATFFNAYDLAALSPVTLTAPINRVRVDAYVGGTWSLDGDGKPQLAGGHWETGELSAGPAVTLPDGVQAEDVQGLRYIFTKADGSNWENPSHPIQRVSFSTTRRDELHTGGPVPSDLAGSTPAPGETVAGDTTNTVIAEVTSSDTDGTGNALTARDEADATIHYARANNAVRVRKTPNSQQNPGKPFTYTLQVTNTGGVPITNPVITDRFPVDGDGPMIVYPETTSQRYAYTTSAGSTIPTDPTQVSVTETANGLTFEFPDGATLPIGGTYTVAFDMQTRPGLPANTAFTNSFGITGDRPWDNCDGTLDAASGECRAVATNTVLSAGAIAVTKQVKAEGSAGPDNLGTTVDPLVTSAVNCVTNSDGFYARPCVPIAKPGGDITWRLHFVNTGNRPIDRIVAVDRLPAPGDALATVPILGRGSQWRPLLDGVRPTLANGTGTLNIWYTTAATPCTLGIGTDASPCPTGSWSQWAAGQPLPVDPDTVTGIKVEILMPGTPLAPAAGIDVDLTMVAPAFSPTAGTDTIAYNTVGMSGRWVTGTNSGYTLTTEPARVGVALATGPLRVVKQVAGEAADQYAPSSFDATLSCTSLGQSVPLTDAQTHLTLVPGVPVTVEKLPYRSDCVLTETDHGQTVSSASTATVQREAVDVETATLTNVYDYASLTVEKTVKTTAVNHNGTGVQYGPFTVDVACTFLGDAVYGAGFGPGDPMTAQLTDDQSVNFTHLPAGAQCTVVESDDKGAVSTSIAATVGTADPVDTDGTTAGLKLAADPTPYTGKESANSAELINRFDVGALSLTKTVTGDAAKGYGSGPFTVHVLCVLDDDSGSRTVYDGDVVLGDAEPLQKRIDNLATGASCAVTETDDGGATETTIDPSGSVTIGTGSTPVAVTIANVFRAGGLQISKLIDGPGASLGSGPFTFSVACAFNGDDSAYTGDVTLTRTGSQTTLTSDEISPLPVGALCTITETDDGAADRTPPPVTVTIPDVDSAGDAQTVVAGFVNTYSAATVAVSKVVDGAGASRADGDVFTIDVMCELDDGAGERVTVYSGSVDVAGGEVQTVAAADGSSVLLPLGAHCWAAEPDSGGASKTTIDHDSWDDATVVEAADQVGAMTITVTNTFDPLPSELLPGTGGPARLQLVLGALLLLGGVALVVVARRRREDQ